MSDTYQTNACVPQGCVLSPTLFIIFINDLLEKMNGKIHSYADDTTLHYSSYFKSSTLASQHRTSSRAESSNALNSDMSTALHWGHENLVQFNSSKTQALLISLKKEIEFPPLSMSNNTIQHNNNIQALGIKINDNLNWSDHILQIAKRASQKLGFLSRPQCYFTSASLLQLQGTSASTYGVLLSHMGWSSILCT